MKNILIAGGTGLVGKVLCQSLRSAGNEVGILTRTPDKHRDGILAFGWDLQKGTVSEEALAFADVLVNLSGEPIAGKRWTSKQKQAITWSRVYSNELLLEAFRKAGRFPAVYLSSGGMNFYGDRKEERLDEQSGRGQQGFLPGSCAAWEASVAAWQDIGVRTVQFRMGIVLSTDGGALPVMMQPFSWGIAPYFGNGRQWYSWIHIEDMARMFLFALENPAIRGIYNAASPNPVRNRTLIRTLVKAGRSKPWQVPIPSWVLAVALGEMSETVLSSIYMSVDKIGAAGFRWTYPEIIPAVDNLLSGRG